MIKESDHQIAHAILKHSYTTFFLIDKKGIITYASPSVSTLHLTPKSIINSSFFDLVHKKERKCVREHVQSTINNDPSPQTFYFKPTNKKMGTLWVVTCQNLVDNSELNGILISVKDISQNPKIKKLEQEINQRKKLESELDENKERYQLLIEHANEAICVAQDGVLKFVNPKLCEILKTTEKEFIGKPFTKFIHPDDRKLISQRYKDRLKGKKVPYEYTFRTIDSEGYTHWVQIHAASFLWDGRPATVNLLSEISEQIYTQKKYEKLLDVAPLIIVEFDIDTLTIVSANKPFCESVGLSCEELIGRHARNIGQSSVFEERFNIGIKAIEEDRIIQTTDQRGGRYFFNIFLPMTTPDGNRRLFVIIQDITDIYLAEQKYQRLIDSSPDAIAEVDGKTYKITTINPAMAKNFNSTKESLVGKEWKTLLPPDVYKNRFELGLKVITENKTRYFEDKRGDRYLQNIFVPLQISDDKTNLQIISRDITDFKVTQQRLKENEQKFRTITTSAQDGIVIIDNKGNITFWNNSAERIFGYEESEIFGKHVHHLLVAKDDQIPSVLKGLGNFKKSGKGPSIGRTQELQAKRKNGDVFPIELSLSSVKLQNRWHAIGIVRDITERKQMEDELRKSKELLETRVKQRTTSLEKTLEKLIDSEGRYRTLVEKAPIGIAITDIKGNVLDMNSTIEEMTGFTKDTMDFYKHFANGNDRERIVNILTKHGSLHNLELELIRNNGEHYFALLDIERIQYMGNFVFLVLQRDVTEMKKTEQRLKQVYEFLNNVINSASEFIFTMDQNKKITMWNKTAESKIGMSSTKIIGKKLTQLPFIKNPRVLLDYIKNISSGYAPAEAELVMETRHGATLTFHISVSLIKGVKRESIGYVIIGKDVTRAEELKANIMPGSSYLQYKTSTDTYESLPFDLKSENKPMLFVTRGSIRALYQKTKGLDIDLIYLDDTSKDEHHVATCDELFQSISEYVSSRKNAVVLIDRLDFLIMKNSFEEVLQMIYHLTPIIDRTQAVLIIQINPDMFTKKQFSLLQEELSLFESTRVEDVALEESLYKILNYIYEQNNSNVVVSYSKVGKEFGISKVTTGKRIAELERKGLVSIRLKGRMKSVFTTKKGEDLIEKRKRAKS